MTRRKKLIKGNKGITLVELIISFAILAILSVMAALIVQTSGRTYRGISTDINLQYESQVAMSQIQEYVIDCNGYIAAGSSGLYIFNRTDSGEYMVYKFAKETESDDALYLYIASGWDPENPAALSFGPGQLLSNHVERFAAHAVDAKSGYAKSVDVTIDYAAGNKEFAGKQTIALRNTVTKISEPGA